MKKQKSRWGCLIGVLLVLILLGAGAWWFFQSQALTFDGAPLSPVVVTITSPSSGGDVEAGDFVSLSAQSTAPDAVQSIELFLDGQSLGKVTDPSNASWTWQAWPLGIHSFYAQAADAKGQIGYSQVVLVNVLAGDGTLLVPAGEGQTLEQIGAGYGVPPDQIAGANPIIDPSLPLPGGKQVQVPIPNSEPPDVPAGGGNFIPIKWKIKFTEKADKNYCYLSPGGGKWEKIPKSPFTYFYALENFYTQFLPLKENVTIQAQCWGWLGGVLKFLGQGESQFDAQKPPAEVKIDGGGFILVGIPKVPPIKEDTFLGGEAIPPPFALREPSSAQDCLAHGDPVVANLLCNGLMNAKVKQHIILEWEWKPEACWPGFCKYGVSQIGGYGVYEIDPATNAKKFLANVKPSAMRVAFLPLPWGPKCYGVEAYVDAPGLGVSEMATYCPGSQPAAKIVYVSELEGWLTAVDMLEQGDDCDGEDYSNLGKYFGYQPGDVAVGAYDFESDYDDCYQNVYHTGAVKFKIPISLLPGDAVVQKAYLKFAKVASHYLSEAEAAPEPNACISGVGKAKQDWSGLMDEDHVVKMWGLGGPGYNAPIASVGQYGLLKVDVTPAVKEWLKNPATNHGFILMSSNPPGKNLAFCVTGLGKFELEIQYFVP